MNLFACPLDLVACPLPIPPAEVGYIRLPPTKTGRTRVNPSSAASGGRECTEDAALAALSTNEHALTRAGLWGCADILAPQQQPEHQPVRDQEQRYDDGWNEVCGAQLTRCKPDGVDLIESVEEIGGAPQVEPPAQGHPPLAPQAGQREQSEHRGDEITIGGRARERG